MGCGASQPVQASSPGPDEAHVQEQERTRELERVRELERELDAERIQRLELELALALGEGQRGQMEPKSLPGAADDVKAAPTAAQAHASSPLLDTPAAGPLSASDGQQQASAAKTITTQKRVATFKAVIKGGVKATWALCDEFKDVLPFPGGIGVALIGRAAELLSTALANKDNCEVLVERAAELMDVIIEKHVSQEELAARQNGSSITSTGSRMYRNLMERLRDLLEVILQYTKDYCDRNFIMKLLLTSHDRDQFQSMVDELARLMVDAHFAVSVDTHSTTIEVHAMSTEMKSMMEQVRKQTEYTDRATEVQRIVADLGGIESVLSSRTKIDQVVKHLDAGLQITIAVLQDQVQAAFLAALAEKDEGVHTLIRNTDMRTFWKQFFRGLPKVDWDLWWCAFPHRLIEVVQDKDVVEQVIACMASDVSRRRFQDHVEKADPDTVSVREVELAFPSGDSILEAVDKALRLQDEKGTAASASTTGGSIRTSLGAQETSLRLQHQSSLSRKSGDCALPKLEELYVGRDEEAQAVVKMFEQQLSQGSTSLAAVCMVAGAGMGKSSLSLEIGWKMARAGMCPGGALIVDCREASSFGAVLGRMCSALGVPWDDHAASNIKSNLAARYRTWNGALLMLLDNVEDPISGHEGAQLADYLVEISKEAMLLITSRVPVAAEKGMQQYELGSMDASACMVLMRSTSPDLEDVEVRDAVSFCQGVPLLVRRAADALQTGQITLQDLQGAVAAQTGRTEAVLKLSLCTMPLHQQLQLAQLSVFPSGFTDAGAAAVLTWTESRAHGLLNVFYRHGLVTRDSSNNRYSLHMAVRKAAAAMGGEAILSRSQARFVTYVFNQLGQWARLFYTPAWEAPLSLAREAGADILTAFKLAGKLAEDLSAPPAGLLPVVLAVCVTTVASLLYCAGYRKGTWSHLRMLHKCREVQGAEKSMQAAALLLKCKSEDDCVAAKTAHDLCLQALGPDHPLTLACVHALAVQLERQHRYQEAEALYRESYEARLRVEGPQSPTTWSSLQALASCIGDDQSLCAKAEPLWCKLLEEKEHALGELHPETYDAKDGLARCLGDSGKLSEAEALYRDSLASRQRVLGADHPDSMTSVNNLAICLKKQGKLSEAEALYRDSLASRQRVLGADHPDSMTSVKNLANCLQEQGKLSEAEALYRDSLASRQRVLDADHPDSIDSVNNLASCLQDQGKLSEAEALYRDSLASRQRVLGADHPDSIASVNNLASCLWKQGKLSEAEALYRDSLASRQRVLGADHPDSMTSVNNLATCLQDQGKLSEAEALYRDSLASRQRVLGADHPYSIASVYNLASCLKKQGKLSEAQLLQR